MRPTPSCPSSVLKASGSAMTFAPNTPPPTNPLYLASQAQQFGREAPSADKAVFNKITMACMITVAVGGILQVIGPMIRDAFKALVPPAQPQPQGDPRLIRELLDRLDRKYEREDERGR